MRFSSFLLKSIYCLLLLVATTHCCTMRGRGVQYNNSGSPGHLLDSTVALVTESSDSLSEYYTYCSGVWITSNKFLTAKHCVDRDNKRVVGSLVRFKTRREVNIAGNQLTTNSPHWGMVWAIDEKHDLALVSAIDNGVHGIVSIKDGDIEVGDEIKVVGHTSGLQYTYLVGVISSIRINMDSDMNGKLLQVSVPAFRGNSGGGVFDQDGNLLGICSTLYVRAPNVVFFIHRDEIVQFLQESNIYF